MNNKKILFSIFIVVAIIQLAIPAKMIWEKESILISGKEIKFETAPVDPTDPFRGKYIVLDYKENSITVDSADEWFNVEYVYVILSTNAKGFAQIKSVSKEKPSDQIDYVKARVGWLGGFNLRTLTVEYPFDRFYMEESKAYDAELAYNETQMDSTKITYALVKIKNGDAVIKDVLIDGVSIVEIVKENQVNK